MPVYTGPPKPPAEPLPVERSGPHKAYVYKQGKAPLIVFEPLEMERTTGSIAVPIVVSLGVNP